MGGFATEMVRYQAVSDSSARSSSDGLRLRNETTYRDLKIVPGFFHLMLASVCCKSAARMYQVLLVLFVLAIYHSPGLSGLLLLVSLIPGIVLSPLAGALLDRRGRVVLMAIDYFVAGLSVTSVMTLSLLHALSVPVLFVIVGCGSVTQPLSAVGSRSLLPAIVPRHLWDRANGLDSTTYVIAAVLGPAAAGLGVAVIGVRWALGIPILLYMCAALALIGVHVPSPAPVDGTSLLEDALGAVHYVFGNQLLRQLALLMTIFNAAIAVTTVAVPVYVIRHLHGGSTTTGLMIATLGFFGFVSSLAMGAVGTENRERQLMVGACALAALGLGLCALAVHDELLGFAALAVTGMANGPMTVTMFTLRQRATDPRWFGRAFAVSMNLNSAGSPLAAAAVGGIAARSVSGAFLFGVGLAVLAGVWPIVFPYKATERAVELVQFAPVVEPAES
jgi:MFS family permease